MRVCLGGSCGTPWSEVAQQMHGGVLGSDASVSWHVIDAIHSVSDINPVHLPFIWSHCATPPGNGSRPACLINATTVTQPMRAVLDPFDTGFSLTAATELRIKLSSRQALQLAAGMVPSRVNFTKTDVLPSLCGAINKKAYEWALSNAGAVARRRFEARGTPLVMAKDTFLGNAGPPSRHFPLHDHLNACM